MPWILGLRQSFFNRNLSLNFSVRDIFNTRKRSSITWGDNFYQRSESYFSGRMIGLTATWNFGNMMPKNNMKMRERGESEDEFDLEGFGED